MSITTAGSITVVIQEQPFTLKGLIGNTINVQYHKTPEEGLELGTVGELANEIAKLFGLDENFRKAMDKLLEDLAGVSASLKSIVETLMKSHIIITDLGINTAEPETYQFGFYVRLKEAQLGPITISGFGVLFTYEKESGKSELQTLPAV